MRDKTEYQVGIEKLSKEFADKGRLIEVGWLSFRAIAVPPTASEGQVKDLRIAFFAGARHLFDSLMTIFESDDEPTETNMRRMALVNEELDALVNEINGVKNTTN